MVVTDMEQGKVDRAVRAGAAGGVLADADRLEEDVRALLEGPADMVFDCVANERSLQQGVGVLRRAGTLLVVGVPARPAPVALPLIQDREIRLQGCAAYTHEDIVAAMKIAQAGHVPMDELVSATFPLHGITGARLVEQDMQSVPDCGRACGRCPTRGVGGRTDRARSYEGATRLSRG